MTRLPRPQHAQKIGFSWRERLLVALVAALLAGLLWGGWGLFLSSVTQDFEKSWQDQLRSRLSPTKERADLIFLGIDEESQSLSAVLDQEIEDSEALQAMLDPMPWSRRVWAEAVNRLGDAGARLIVFDVHFPGPLRTADGQDLDPEGDRLFAEAIAKHRDKVVLVSIWEGHEVGVGENQNERQRYVPPYDFFLRAGGEPVVTGFANFYTEEGDPIFRHADFTRTSNEVNGLEPHPDEPVYLSLAAACATKLGVDVPAGGSLRFAGGKDELVEGYIASAAYQPHSLYGIFAEGVWKANYKEGEYFKDKVVLIGAAERIQKDEILTPSGVIFGPQMHLQALGCLLEDSFWHESPSWLNWLALFVMAGIAALLVMGIRSPVLVLGLVVLIAVVWGFGCSYVADSTSVLFTGFSGLLGLVFVSVGCEGTEFFFEQKARKKLHRQLSRSVSRDVAEAMARAPEGYLDAARGGRRTVAILFSDVRNFTARSERMEPEALVEQLNAYFGAMVEAVFATGGTIDKFIGDAVMASWGGLIDRSEEEMAALSLEAAEGMEEALARLNVEWEAKGWEGFEVGIGIHIGEAVVGEIGSEERSDFTAIGDAVNVASRIEGMTKQLGVPLLVSGRVAKSAEADLVLLGALRVTGREEGLEIFTSAGEGAEAWKKGLAALRRGDVAGAREAWAMLKDSEDRLIGPVQFYEHWLTEQEGTVPTDWDGVVRLSVK